ncbi:MAG: hypothetical protein ACTHM2_06505 [Afipia sp.]
MTKPVEMLRRRQTPAVLRELVNRIADQCAEQGREDLVYGLHLLERIALRDRRALSRDRAQMLQILVDDDVLILAGERFEDHFRQLDEAMQERTASTVQ